MSPASVRAAMRKYVPHGDFYRLAGPGNAGLRQQCMLEMTGQKMPRAQCGVTTLRQIAFDVSQVTGDCLAAREDNLLAWVQS